MADGYLQSAGGYWRDVYIPQGENFTLSDYLEVPDGLVGNEYTVLIYDRSYDAEWNAVDTLISQYQTVAEDSGGTPVLAINYSESPVEQLYREIYITYRPK